MKRFVSLSLKITTFATSIIIAVSIAVAITVYFSMNGFFFGVAKKNITTETRLLATDIENSLIKITNDMKVLSKTPPIQGIVRSVENSGVDTIGDSNIGQWKERLATIFKSMLESNPNYTQIRYIGVADGGRELVRVNQSDQGIFATAESSLQQKSGRDYFKRGTELSQGSTSFSNINYNIEHGKIQKPYEVTLRALAPVYTNKQKIFGMIVINVNISRYLRNTLLRSAADYDVILYDAQNDFFIFNHKNKTLAYLSHTDTIKLGLFGNPEIKSTKQIIPFLRNDNNRINVMQPIYSNTDKDQKVLTIVVSVPKASIESEDLSLLQEILFWVIVVCIVAIVSIYIFTKRSLLPLSQMAKSISEMDQFSDKQIDLPVNLNNEVGLLANAFSDKTKLLSRLALYDSLTGLANRKSFIDRVGMAIHQANRIDDMIAVIYLDVDKFKEVNDVYGHDYGDQLLIQFSQTLCKVVRENDFCARIGGDEFAALLEGISSEDEIDPILMRYQAALSKTFSIKGVTINMVISGGVAIYPHDASSVDDLINHADQAMYESKQEGLGHIHRYRLPS